MVIISYQKRINQGIPMPQNKQVLLDNRPEGEATAANFRLATTDTPPLQDGQVLVRHHF
jgi:NADPH-dependent curcumin reductase CurA